MYEPTRTRHAVRTHGPHRSREEELTIRLAGHLTALLTVTDELHALTPSPELDDAARRLALRVKHLRGSSPLRAAPTPSTPSPARPWSSRPSAATRRGRPWRQSGCMPTRRSWGSRTRGEVCAVEPPGGSPAPASRTTLGCLP